MRLRNHMLNTDSQVDELNELKEAIVELYLAIKIRSTEEVRLPCTRIIIMPLLIVALLILLFYFSAVGPNNGQST